MSEQVYRQGDHLRTVEELMTGLVAISEDVSKLDLNPTSAAAKKRVVVILNDHIVKVRGFIEQVNSITKTE